MDNYLSEVPLSKIKMLKYTTVALVILAMGIDMFFDSRTEQGFMYYFGQTFGIFSMVFFGSVFLFGLFLLIRSKQGLIFTTEGFKDYSCFGMGKFIKWDEVSDIERIELYRNKYIKVLLKDPEGFISTCSGIAKYIYKLNHQLYGTPLFISPLLLNSSFDNLFSQVQIHWSTAK